MTLEQRRKTKDALVRYREQCWGSDAAHRGWSTAIQQTLDYYDRQDPVRAQLLRVRYLERTTEEETIDRLHIGRTTYQKAQLDLLSTLAVYAAQQGVL